MQQKLQRDGAVSDDTRKRKINKNKNSLDVFDLPG